MCVDVSKIRKGDKLLLEVEVTHTPCPTASAVCATAGGYQITAWLPNVKQHIPAPRPIEVGCKVIHNTCSRSDYARIPVVQSIVGNKMWIKTKHNNTEDHDIVDINQYQRID